MDGIEREPLFERMLIEDVPLPRAPLARVIGQLRFPTLSAFVDTAAKSFIGALSDSYPFLEEGLEQALTFNVGQQSVQQVQSSSGKIWRLRSEDGQSVVALTNGALTLETAAYAGRGAFCDELIRLAGVLQSAVRVPAYHRIAIRYTNRLAGHDTLTVLTQLIHPEFLGLVGVPKAPSLQLAYSMSQSMLVLDDGGKLLVQSGYLPEGASFDPSLPAVGEPSWVLDVDSFEEFSDARTFLAADNTAVNEAAHRCAQRAHTLFRRAVTIDFLKHFGGQP